MTLRRAQKVAAPRQAYRRVLVVGVAAVAFAVTLTGSVLAAPGEFDPSFGTNGEVQTNVMGGGSSDILTDLAALSDGKILAVGSTQNRGDFGVECSPGVPTTVNCGGANANWSVARYNADGTLDPTFAVGADDVGRGAGAVPWDRNNLIGGKAMALALMADGAFVAVGRVFDPQLARWRAAVAFFDERGRSSGPIKVTEGNDAILNDVLVQSDGRIVAAGQVEGTPGGFAIVRLNADGTMDSGFGAGGIAVVDLAPGLADEALALRLQADGKIVATGNTFLSASSRTVAVLRLESDGSLDPTFGTAGVTVTSLPGGASEAAALAIQPDGKIVVGGRASNGTRFALLRYDSAGVLDPSFGSGGVVQTDLSLGNDRISDIALQADGAIVAAGAGTTLNRLTVARYRSDGSLDVDFGAGGAVAAASGGVQSEGNAVALCGDKIVAGGLVRATPPDPDTDFGLVGLRSDSIEICASAPTPPPAPLVVRGTLQWTDYRGGLHPLRSAPVRIYDAESHAPDELLGVAYTSPEGNFAFDVPDNEDGPGQSHRDLYVLLKPDLPGRFTFNDPCPLPAGCDVNSGDLEWQSTVEQDVADGATVSVGHIALDTDPLGQALSIQQALIAGVQWVERAGLLDDLGQFEVVYPADVQNGCADPRFNSGCSTHWGLPVPAFSGKKLFVTFDDWMDWDVALHEFTHFMGEQFGFDGGDGGRHSLDAGPLTGVDGRDKEEAMKLAWSEGVADFFGSMIPHEMGITDVPHAGRNCPPRPGETESLCPEYEDVPRLGGGWGSPEPEYWLDVNAPTSAQPYTPEKSGEDAESSVLSFLYDITYGDEMLREAPVPISTRFASSAEVIGYLHRSKPQTLASAHQAFMGPVYGSGGCAPELQRISPTHVRMIFPNGKANPPVVTWAAGNAGRNDRFRVRFGNFFGPGLSSHVTSERVFIPTGEQWSRFAEAYVGSVINGTSSPEPPPVEVEGKWSRDPSTGWYRSCAHKENESVWAGAPVREQDVRPSYRLDPSPAEWSRYETILDRLGLPSASAMGLILSPGHGLAIDMGCRGDDVASLPDIARSFCWNRRDRNDRHWYPQGIASSIESGWKLASLGPSGRDREVLVVTWYKRKKPSVAGGETEARISLVDLAPPGNQAPRYWHIPLKEPSTDCGRKVRCLNDIADFHAGGAAWIGRYLYIPDTQRGLRVFDLKHAVIEKGQLVLPQIGWYQRDTPGDLRFSFASIDLPQGSLVTGEFVDGEGRLVEWPVAKRTSFFDPAAEDRPLIEGPWSQHAYGGVSIATRHNERCLQGVAIVNETILLSRSGPQCNLVNPLALNKLFVRGFEDGSARELPWIEGGEDLAVGRLGTLWGLGEHPGDRTVVAVPLASVLP